jgi:predicted glycosyltransferase
MNAFINISHPAHVHFFKNTIALLSGRGHHVIIGARKKEFTVDLLNAYGIDHVILTDRRKGLLGLLKELLEQQLKISSILKRNSIDLMLQIGGIFNAPVGRFFRIPTLAFSDTENDKWGNKLSFGLSKHILCPACFDHRAGGSWKKQIHYPGYHELAYLSPQYVTGEIKPGDKFLLRFVGWAAGHDIGEQGLSDDQKIEIASLLSRFGSIHISSEAPLPSTISGFASKIHPSEIHDFMRSCKMVVGESATMASEAACLGIPAVFISNTGRGYTTEQDRKYGLIKHYRIDQWDNVMKTLEEWAQQDLNRHWQEKRWNMLREKIDVTAWLLDLIENYPQSIKKTQDGDFERYLIKCAA